MYTCIYIYIWYFNIKINNIYKRSDYVYLFGVLKSDVNDADPRLLDIYAEPRLSFSEKKNEPEPNRDSSQTRPS